MQAMAFAPVVEGKTSIIADQSGSGKTLAYLAPVIQRLREEELQGLSKPLSQSPRVVILVPTAELASQVSFCCVSNLLFSSCDLHAFSSCCQLSPLLRLIRQQFSELFTY